MQDCGKKTLITGNLVTTVNPSWQSQITNLLQPHFKSTEKFFFYYSEDFIFKEIQPTLWNLAGCKTVGKFQYFKEVFMMTSLHTDARRQASNAGVRGPPQGRVMYTQVGLAVTRHTHSSRRKRPYWLFEGRESVCPHSPHLPLTHPSRSLCLSLHKAAALSCIWRSKSILNRGTLFHSGEGRLHEHLQRSFFFFFFFSLSITVASVSTLRGTEGNIFKSKHLRVEKEKKSWIMQQSQVRMQTLPYCRRMEYETVESISCIFFSNP